MRMTHWSTLYAYDIIGVVPMKEVTFFGAHIMWLSKLVLVNFHQLFKKTVTLLSNQRGQREEARGDGEEFFEFQRKKG